MTYPTNPPPITREPIRADRYISTSYKAFRISSGRTYAVSLGGFLLPSVDDATNAALLAQAFAHKDHLLIRETGPCGVKAHLFAIKRQSAPTPVYRDYVTRQEHRLYAAPVCVIDGGVFAQAFEQDNEGAAR